MAIGVNTVHIQIRFNRSGSISGAASQD